jgi:hypothetical protein
MAGLAPGLIVYGQTRIWMAETIAGNTYAMPRDPFIATVFALLVGAVVCVSAGYAIAAGARTARSGRSPSRPDRRGATAIGATALAIPILALGCAAWLSATAVRLADDKAAGAHQLTVTGEALVLDAPTIKSGLATFLVTASGHAPTDLTLVQESSVPTFYSVGTPPDGSVEGVWSITLTPGTWRFMADGGRLVARFEVIP